MKTFWEKIDEKVFAGLFLIGTIAAIYFFAPGSSMAVAEIIVLKMIYVSTLLFVAIGMLFFFRGTKYDIYEEIFDEHNVAAAIVTGALLIAIASVVGK